MGHAPSNGAAEFCSDRHMPALHCEQRELADGAVAVVLHGQLQADTAADARREIAEAREHHDGALLIDVHDVEAADAFGIALLLKAQLVHDAHLVGMSPALTEAALSSGAPGELL
jgi:anti-anti-sigma regulatory factor